MAVGAQTTNDLMVAFSNTISAGFDALQGSVNGVFGLMIALVVALTGIHWALSPNREILASGFGKVLLIGAFAWLINDWQQLSETVYAGFIELGLTAGGGSLSRADFLNPGAILAQGWSIVKALGETPAPVANPLDVVGNMTDALILGLAMIGIMLAFAVLALQIVVALLEFKIVTLGGFILLPFGIWNRSAIVVSGATTLFDQLQPSTNPDIYEALSILVAAILLAMLAVFVPNLASALVTGGPALGAGAALTGALAVTGAGALAVAGVARAGAMAGGGAARMAAPARAAAGAGSTRPSGPPPGPGGFEPASSPPPPRPSNDNPFPDRPGAASGVSEPAPARYPMPADPGTDPGRDPTSKPGHTPASRPEAVIGREAETARRAFHQHAAGDSAASPAPRPGRSAALQAFFVANAGRGLMPSAETSGVLSPNLRTEER